MLSPLNVRGSMLDVLTEEFDSFFDDFWVKDRLNSMRSKSRSGYPKTDIIENDEFYRIEAAVPGVSPDNLKVEVIPPTKNQEWQTLRISGKMEEVFQYPKNTLYHCKELKKSEFTREISLPIWIGEIQPEAKYENGVVRLTWQKPLKEEVPVKQISIDKA